MHQEKASVLRLFPSTHLESQQRVIMSTEEVWKPIRGYEGSYAVSNRGRVRSLARGNRPGRILRLADNKKQVVVTLSQDGMTRTFGVARLVANHFIPNPYPEYDKYVVHDNRNYQDNRADNLFWSQYKDRPHYEVEQTNEVN